MAFSAFYRPFIHSDTHTAKFSRYLLVGGLMLLFNLILVALFVEVITLHYLVALVITFFIETFVAFFINRHWTFRTKTTMGKWYAKFFTIALYSFLFVVILTYGLMNFLAFHYVWARVFATMISGFVGYFLDLKITFRV